MAQNHDGIIKWKHFPYYWPFVRGIYMWPMDSPHKNEWCRALILPLICAWTNSWDVRGAGDLRCHCTYYDITVMTLSSVCLQMTLATMLQTKCPMHFLSILISNILHQQSKKEFYSLKLCIKLLWCCNIYRKLPTFLFLCICWWFLAIFFFHNVVNVRSSKPLPNCNGNKYRKVSNIRRTKLPNLTASRLVLQLSLPNPMKPGVKSRMKMQLEQRRQAMLRLHLSDRQFYCLLRCAYIRDLTVVKLWRYPG